MVTPDPAILSSGGNIPMGTITDEYILTHLDTILTTPSPTVSEEAVSEETIKISEKISNWVKQHSKTIQRAAIIAEMFGFMMSRNINESLDGIYATLIPEAIVGAVPLYCIQSIERGMSDREVKYRATGDVFLAHQRGTTDSLRIDGTLIGPYRYIYLMFLLRLQNLGEAELKELTDKDFNMVSPDNVRKSDIVRFEEGKPVMYESHRTFPIITQTMVILDMFLQTIEWHSSVEDGIEVVKYTLLFRKHIEPRGWRSVSGEKKKAALFYDDSITKRQREETMFDMMWKTMRTGSELFRGAMFGGIDSREINREAVSTIPYTVDIKKMLDGFNLELYGETTWVK